jgi:hypothetical protein
MDGYNDGFVRANRTARPITRNVYHSEVDYKSYNALNQLYNSLLRIFESEY